MGEAFNKIVETVSATITSVLSAFSGTILEPTLMVLLLGTGLFLTIGLRFLSLRYIPQGFRLLWRGRDKNDAIDGELSPFNALMTALAATVGTGNIAGVATAIFYGGPGALFWMWMTALVGMATKYSETVLSVHYREVTPAGHVVGGPMYAIKNGLGKKWLWLGTAFAIFGGLAGFGIGNLTQSNSIAQGLSSTFGIPQGATAVVLLVLIGLVLVGGVSRIGSVAGKIVPFMTLLYMGSALVIIALHITEIPSVFLMVIRSAFDPQSVQGGAAGATVMLAVRYGVARGIFSNEAGLGSAAIAHACATSKNPVTMGLIGMLGTFIDTILVCSMTGFTILLSGLWMPHDLNGAPLTSAAFDAVLPGLGASLVSISLVLFAFTTILGWCVYSERCWVYLFGDRALRPFRIIFTLAVPIGAIAQLDTVWLIADVLNTLMALPNLVSLLLLSPILFKLTKEYVHKEKR